MATIAEQLAESTIFKGVNDTADREALIQSMRRETHPAGKVLFQKDEPGDSMYIILSGRVRIFTLDAEGREIPIRDYGPPQMFGEFAILDDQPRSASAVATEPLEVLVLSRQIFLDFLKERPVVGLSMMRNMVDRVRYTTIYMKNVLDATQRLSRGEYEKAVQQMASSETDSETQKLVDVFIQLLRSVQERENTLKQQRKS